MHKTDQIIQHATFNDNNNNTDNINNNYHLDI